MIGVRNSSCLPTILKRIKMIYLMVSRFSPDVSATDTEKSLLEVLGPNLLEFLITCALSILKLYVYGNVAK
jgi:hypothetical protein